MALWNYLFLSHIQLTGYRGDIFRNALSTLQSPLYGVAAPITLVGLVAMLATVVAYGGASLCLKRFGTDNGLVLVGVFMALHLLGITAVGLVENPERIFDFSVLYGGIAEGPNLERFQSLLDVWANWNEQLNSLQGRAGHYPPGVMLVAMLERRFEWPGLLGYTSILLTVLCVPLIVLQCRLAGLSRTVTQAALALQIGGAGMLVFPRVDFSPIAAFLTILSVLGVTLAMQRKARYAICSGIALALGALLTFSVAISGLILVLFVLVMVALRAISVRKAAAILAGLSAGAVGVWLGIYLLFEFNILQCLVLSIRNNGAAMTPTPFDMLSRYGLRSTGNLFAYLSSLGPVTGLLAAVGLAKSSRQNPLVLALAIATLGALLFASFSTLFFLETERIWVFFTPLMAIVAAFGLAKVVPDAYREAYLVWIPVAVLIGSSAQVLAMTRDMPADEHIEAAAWQRTRELLRP
jgi:hypothetical protein